MMGNLRRALPCAIRLLIAVLIFVPRSNHAAPAAEQSRAVILISVDGLASFYLDDPRAEMPTIRALAEAGVRAARMKASAPTVTWPNHTTLVTGMTPARHGVVGNDYFDRARRKTVILISDPEYDKEQLVRVPTIYDLAKARGLSTAAIRWPATRNAKALDWTLPDVFSDELLHRFTTPSLMAECKQAGIWSESDVIRYGQRELRVVSDDMCTRVFNFILRKHHPSLALLHLTHVDSVEHLKGPRTPEAYAAIKAADEQVRQVWDEVKRDYPGQATVMIVSDHGFSPVERLILPNVALRDAKLVDVKAGKAEGGAVHIVNQGGAALLYVLDSSHKDAVISQVQRLFAGVEGVDKVIGPEELKLHGLAKPQDDPRSPDVVLFAREGYCFDETASGSALTVPRRDLRGMHGHDENLPCMYATFIAWGAGIKRRTTLEEIQNTDVAPTIAHLLNLPLTGADGKALAAALAE
jgi:predicted AlkP superfamily pyrophosphatase or phosphodiesterase